MYEGGRRFGQRNIKCEIKKRGRLAENFGYPMSKSKTEGGLISLLYKGKRGRQHCWDTGPVTENLLEDTGGMRTKAFFESLKWCRI